MELQTIQWSQQIEPFKQTPIKANTIGYHLILCFGPN